MPLWEVAMLKMPTPKQEEDGKQEELIFGPVAVVAANDKTAALIAMKNNPKAADLDLNNVQVLVRPFVSVSHE